MSRHAISTAGLALIQHYEGFRAEPAQLPDGNWVVGFGHVRAGEAGAAVTESEAADLLAIDAAPVELAVNESLTRDIAQSQFDALVSFAFSIGVDAFRKSDVPRRVNAGNDIAAACAMDAWRKGEVNGDVVVVDALVRRRAAEKALYLKDAACEVAPSALMRAKIDYAAAVLGAPVKHAAALKVGSLPVIAPQPEPTQRLSEILKSEPATEALLLTRVVGHDEVADDEITTAHAKPVARVVDQAHGALQRAAEEAAQQQRQRSQGGRVRFGNPADLFGLAALSLFGVGLVGLGGWTLLGGSRDAVDIMAAAALSVPGVAALTLAGLALVRGPAVRRA